MVTSRTFWHVCIFILVTELCERFAFYDEARSAYAIVQCLERRPYGNVVLTKGVVGPDGKDLKPEAPAGPPAAKKARKK